MIHGRQGFTLLEVVVTVAVVALTALYVLRAFAAGLECMSLSNDLTQACFIAEDKMWDVRQRQKKGDELVSGEENVSAQNREFSCVWEVQKLPEPGLTQAIVKVSWGGKSFRKGRSVDFQTILMPEAP